MKTFFINRCRHPIAIVALLVMAAAPSIFCEKIIYPNPDKKIVHIPIEIFDGVVYLKAQINGEYEAQLILDTGADSISALSIDLAGKLGVLGENGTRIGKGGPEGIGVKRIYGTRLNVGGIACEDFDLIALPLGKMEPYWGRKIDGIMGGNLIKNFVVSIDYAQGILTISDQLDDEAKGFKYSLPMQVMGTTPMIQVNIKKFGDSKPISGDFIVDTGVRFSFLNTPFTSRHELLGQSPKIIENITGFGVGGLIIEKVGRIAYLDLGGAKLENPVIQFSCGKDGISASNLFSGIVGADLLQRFTVVFDFSHKMIYLNPNENFSKPFSYDMSGIYFTMTAGTIKQVQIVNIVEDSPANLAGIKKGDSLLEVNGKPVSAYSMPQLKEFFKRAGREVTLKVERDGKPKVFTFLLKPYV